MRLLSILAALAAVITRTAAADPPTNASAAAPFPDAAPPPTPGAAQVAYFTAVTLNLRNATFLLRNLREPGRTPLLQTTPAVVVAQLEADAAAGNSQAAQLPAPAEPLEPAAQYAVLDAARALALEVGRRSDELVRVVNYFAEGAGGAPGLKARVLAVLRAELEGQEAFRERQGGVVGSPLVAGALEALGGYVGRVLQSAILVFED